MLVIPAIDLKDGKIVRLYQGKKEKVVFTWRDCDFLELAKKFSAVGVKRLHLVDLDGAFSGSPRYIPEVLQIKKETSLVVEFGGGLRTKEIVAEVLDKGIDFCVLTTLVLSNFYDFRQLLSKYPGRIIVSVDIAGEKVVTCGWEKESDYSWTDFLKKLKDEGVEQIIITDVQRDGTVAGVNKLLVEKAKKIVSCGLIVAGGVNSLKDLLWLKDTGVFGVILGRAIYEGKIDLAEAIRLSNAG